MRIKAQVTLADTQYQLDLQLHNHISHWININLMIKSSDGWGWKEYSHNQWYIAVADCAAGKQH